MKLKVWVEIMTATDLSEDVVEVSDARWESMTPAEREEYKRGCFEDMLGNLVSGGCEEIEDE